MIILKLQGGLGNQMFQWAYGKSLSLKYNLPLKIDLSFLKRRDLVNNFTYRDYDLDIFTIQNNFDINPIKQVYHILESNFQYDSKYSEFIEKNNGHFYIDGYWQSPKYFNDSILTNFEFTDNINNSSIDTLNILNDIINTESVMINVRRGDFVSSTFHGCITIDYIQNSVNYIKSIINDPKFYIFSDDIDWCKNNIKLDNSVFIEHQHSGNKFAYYLQLMIKCKHHIIPNSTFAWWSAYLNDNPNKIVIATKQWFLDKSINTNDLFPKSWIKL